MRFIDEVTIEASAGNGGDGKVSFWREKYVPRGGPDGADGGRGGDLILRADKQLGTLQDLYYAPHQRAEHGEHGHGRMKNGCDGQDLTVRVPRGTEVYDADTGELLADLVDPGQEYRLKGGRGGLGNCNFATPTRQAPDFAKPGRPGEARRLRLSLKVLADVGLVGFPNAGKSTLLSVVSAAHPKVADYPFTTLSPNLGVVRTERGTFVMADMPGLIEGASDGAGLGHRFLRHLERVRLLVHLVEGGYRDGRDPVADYEIIRDELKSYGTRLAKLPEIVVLTKSDLPETAGHRKKLEKHLAKRRRKLWVISGATREGVEALMKEVAMRVNRARVADGTTVEEPKGAYHPLLVGSARR
ncbi:MAG: GTPase ObgE [Deltaproteobacteria bacterium]|nr:GTPase ObgE [Deltaproteobacteria bacterium]